METSLPGRSGGGGAGVSLDNKEAEATYKAEEAQDLTGVTGIPKVSKVNLWELSANWAGRARNTASQSCHSFEGKFFSNQAAFESPMFLSCKNQNKLTTPPSWTQVE